MSYSAPQIFGIWLAAFLTLCIFSFLFKDNPFYKFAEHLFVGVSAGYQMVVLSLSVIKPNLADPLSDAWHALHDGRGFTTDWFYLIPAILGVIFVLRLVPKISWISRWPLALMVGITAGIAIPSAMNSNILKQIADTIIPLTVAGDMQSTIINYIVLVGTLTGLIYFYFSVEHKGVIMGTGSRVGIYVLMIAFGASFGYTVMARVSLLIGRMQFFKYEFIPMLRYMMHH
jgi:hypothetical protein